jgi:hypothetical protein
MKSEREGREIRKGKNEKEKNKSGRKKKKKNYQILVIVKLANSLFILPLLFSIFSSVSSFQFLLSGKFSSHRPF